MPAPVLWGSRFQIDAEIDVNNSPANAVAALKDGGFISVWGDADPAGQSTGIRGQIHNADGTKRGSAFSINAVVDGIQDSPSVAILKDGRIVVAYHDQGSHDGDQDGSTRVRVIGPNGELGPDFLVNAPRAGNQWVDAVTALENGGFAVAYTSPGDGSAVGIPGQAFDSNLGRVGAESFLNSTTAEAQRSAALTALSNGNFVAVYVDQSGSPDDPSQSALRGRILLPNGQPAATGEFLIPALLDGDQWDPSVTALEGGRFVVIWRHQNSTGDGSDSSIRAQIFEADGRKHGSEFLVNATTAGYQVEPAVTALRGGGFAVTYKSDVGAGYNLLLSTFDAEGRRSGDEIQVVNSPDGTILASSLSTLADGRVMVQWEDEAGGAGLYAQIVDPRFAAITLSGTSFNDHYIGTGFGDTLGGAAGADRLQGEGGNDVLDGGTGADRLEGGLGNDTFSVDSIGDVVVETAGGGTDIVIAAASYSLSASAEVEVLTLASLSSRTAANLTGSSTANAITGHAGTNTLKGEGGNDVLKASSGNDRVYGGLGNDTLSGGAGNDRLYGGTGSDRDIFVFDTRPSKSTNVDKIYDFNPRYDTFQLDNAVFTKLGTGSAARPKKFKSDMFVKATKAQDREDRIIYDKKTGALYYDQDGTGSKAQVKIATLNKNLALTHNDFFVI